MGVNRVNHHRVFIYLCVEGTNLLKVQIFSFLYVLFFTFFFYTLLIFRCASSQHDRTYGSFGIKIPLGFLIIIQGIFLSRLLYYFQLFWVHLIFLTWFEQFPEKGSSDISSPHPQLHLAKKCKIVYPIRGSQYNSNMMWQML